MKVTISEIKKNLQEINSGGNEAENQINALEHKEEKKHSSRTARRKKNSKKQGEAQEPLGHLQMYKHLNHRGARKRRGTRN